MSFPKDFTWGVAAAAYQIEGAVATDGRGPSIWDVFTHEPDRIFENHNGDVACDHYHRYAEDVALMRELGAKAYRLSLAWPRIMPEGTGRVNEKGLAFYDRLIDSLLASGVTPWVTLFHWDLPHALQQRGAWSNREIVDWFGDYAAVVADKLGDRVKHWMTINEPPVVIGLGYQDGVFAPGHKLNYRECLLASHHLLMAHGRATQVLRARCKGPIKVSLAHTSRERIPSTNSAADIEAARRDYFACSKKDMWNLSWWMDPVHLGHYPHDAAEAFGADMPQVTDADLKLIAQPVDFTGYNCYSGWLVRAKPDGSAENVPSSWGIGNARGTLPWLNIAPDATYWAARFIHERYQLPVVFTENGFCNTDFVHLDGKVHDPQRIDFLTRYLAAMKRAVAEGVPVAGYFYWSVMDNFEWKEGYKDRFGLIHVDYQTQKRTPKDSYFWYRDLIRTNGANLPT
jgi:beta-glucosidase